MKKILTVIVLIVMALGFTGCQKAAPSNSLMMKESEVKTAVDGWTVYTNPQFRYELRYPSSWTYYQVNEGGEEVALYPRREALSDSYLGEVKIKGIVNWQNNYSIEDYYNKAAAVNLYKDSIAQDKFEFKGAPAVWFKGVKSLYTGKSIDVITIDMSDRLVELQFINNSETAKTAFNSLYFYGNKTVEPTK